MSRRTSAPLGCLLLALFAAGCREAARSDGPGPAAAPPAEAEGGAGLLVFEAERAGNLDIYTVPVGGGPERRLTDDPAKDALPRFTADGARVIFSSRRSGEWQLYEIGADGSGLSRLRENEAREWQADPSPDGRRLAFLSNLDGPESLWIQPLGGRRQRLLVRHGGRSMLGNPSWSPDGTRIAFSSNHRTPGHRVLVVDVASGEERRISPLGSGGCEPRFGRDGRRVAYVRRSHLTRDTSTIVEHDLESGEERVLVDWPALNYDPAYSPDGGELAFASTVAGEFAIYRLRLRDGRSWRVTHAPGVARHPDYQPAR